MLLVNSDFVNSNLRLLKVLNEYPYNRDTMSYTKDTIIKTLRQYLADNIYDKLCR